MSVDTSMLEAEIVSDLKAELNNEESFNEGVLAVKVKLAVRDVLGRRNYKATSWGEKKILDDLYENYYSTISNLARFDYNQMGAEGEISHSENGISRTYVDRDSLLKGVHAFVGIIN